VRSTVRGVVTRFGHDLSHECANHSHAAERFAHDLLDMSVRFCMDRKSGIALVAMMPMTRATRGTMMMSRLESGTSSRAHMMTPRRA